MRLELLGCTVLCQSQLGVEDGTIPDSSFTSSSSLQSAGFQADRVRPGCIGFLIMDHSHLLSVDREDNWIQVDFGEPTRISGLILESWTLESYGCTYGFYLKHRTSNDSTGWISIRNNYGNEAFLPTEGVPVFYCREERTTSFFSQSVLTQFIRMYIAHIDLISSQTCAWMKFDFLGCRRHLQTARTCQTLHAEGYLLDDTYEIDMDGLNQGQLPFQVFCNMSTGTTIIHHDGEDSFKIGEPQSRAITYNIDVQQVISVIENSLSCQQIVRVVCPTTNLTASPSPLTSQPFKWGARNGEIMPNWGVPTGKTGCDCGLTDECNADHQKCNCGYARNRSHWDYDEGILTDKDALPVTLIKSDTIEELHVTVGALICKWKHPSSGNM
ncbi:EGF and laminin G domain-containing protein-like [Acanthaster planci]|uniref:EGF and laminin G domain-containing protein-like n=1 Tax=Acanthaster planci TaxID=133434 RepID=A0A8B7ZL21_ACAPL|nr:EGF and laminin G domain-containing protein-like [Acanthaster planci]